MSIPNAYCKKHDEIEPQDNTEFWTCPKCPKETKQTNRCKTLDVYVKALKPLKLKGKL